jgi:hypothetical protein
MWDMERKATHLFLVLPVDQAHLPKAVDLCQVRSPLPPHSLLLLLRFFQQAGTLPLFSPAQSIREWARWRVLIQTEFTLLEILQCNFSSALKVTLSSPHLFSSSHSLLLFQRIAELLFLFGSFSSKNKMTSSVIITSSLDDHEYLLDYVLGQYCICFDKEQSASTRFSSALKHVRVCRSASSPVSLSPLFLFSLSRSRSILCSCLFLHFIAPSMF